MDYVFNELKFAHKKKQNDKETRTPIFRNHTDDKLKFLQGLHTEVQDIYNDVNTTDDTKNNCLIVFECLPQWFNHRSTSALVDFSLMTDSEYEDFFINERESIMAILEASMPMPALPHLGEQFPKLPNNIKIY
jgi:hypothetical protein